MVWTCPKCGRSFGAIGRGHVCAPGITLDELLDGSHPSTGPIVERLLARLRTVDVARELIVDPVPGKLMLKRDAVFCIVEPKTKWVAVGFQLGRRLDSPRLSRKVMSSGAKHYHVVNAHDAEDVDEELLDWIVEAFAGDEADAPSVDPMVPDDVDIFPRRP